MSKDEIIKKLAEATVKSYIVCKDDSYDYCVHCNIRDTWNGIDKYGIKHESDCPVLLAEEVLKDLTK